MDRHSGTVVEHSTIDPEIKGSKPAATLHKKKMEREKMINLDLLLGVATGTACFKNVLTIV